MKLVTPAKGVIEISKEKDPELFQKVQCGLGAFGVVSEATLQCVDMHLLEEKTMVMSRKEVRENHARLIQENKHLKYLWLPYTDSVVVFTINPTDSPKNTIGQYTLDEKLKPVRDLLLSMSPQVDYHNLSFTELRDELIALDPINVEHIKKVNNVESLFWKRNQEIRVNTSDQILGMDCGGHQWINEVAFDIGPLHPPSLKDVEFVERLLDLIETHQLSAHSPIEQRWTCASSGLLSPAYHPDPSHIFTWVGIIMYLPPDDPHKRDQITQAFKHYQQTCRKELYEEYKAKEHWAKLEFPEDKEEQLSLYQRIHQSYDLTSIIHLRKELDPNDILSNPMTSFLLSKH